MSDEPLVPGPDNLESSYQEVIQIPYPPCNCGRSATEYCEKKECDFTEEEWQAKQNEPVIEEPDQFVDNEPELPYNQSYTPE